MPRTDHKSHVSFCVVSLVVVGATVVLDSIFCPDIPWGKESVVGLFESLSLSLRWT